MWIGLPLIVLIISIEIQKLIGIDWESLGSSATVSTCRMLASHQRTRLVLQIAIEIPTFVGVFSVENAEIAENCP